MWRTNSSKEIEQDRRREQAIGKVKGLSLVAARSKWSIVSSGESLRISMCTFTSPDDQLPVTTGQLLGAQGMCVCGWGRGNRVQPQSQAGLKPPTLCFSLQCTADDRQELLSQRLSTWHYRRGSKMLQAASVWQDQAESQLLGRPAEETSYLLKENDQAL